MVSGLGLRVVLEVELETEVEVEVERMEESESADEAEDVEDVDSLERLRACVWNADGWKLEAENDDAGWWDVEGEDGGGGWRGEEVNGWLQGCEKGCEYEVGRMLELGRVVLPFMGSSRIWVIIFWGSSVGCWFGCRR